MESNPSRTQGLIETFYNLPSKFLKSPRRFDIFIWTIIIWLCLLVESERETLLRTITLSVPFRFSISVSSLTFSFVVKFIIAFLFSFASNLSLHFYIQSYLGILKTSEADKIIQLVKLLNKQSGIKKIYEDRLRVAAINQQYSRDVMEELSHSETIKLLSIAGYEYIGKGEGESLFYDVLRERNWIKVESVILNPDNDEVINERIHQLRKILPPYTKEDLKKEICNTIDKFKTLNKIRSDRTVQLYYCKFHPIFRLIILDKCLFMSTYEIDRHGHESPVYKIDKVTEDNKDNLSLYDSFNNLFDKLKENSTEVSL